MNKYFSKKKPTSSKEQVSHVSRNLRRKHQHNHVRKTPQKHTHTPLTNMYVIRTLPAPPPPPVAPRPPSHNRNTNTQQQQQKAGIGSGSAATTPTAAAAAAAGAVAATREAPAIDATLEPTTADASAATSGGLAREGVTQAVQGVGEVLDETWDMAESPNFAAALQVRLFFFF